MKKRMILGFRADVRETSEATLADMRAVSQILSALDGEKPELADESREAMRRRKHNLIELTRYHLGDAYARVANALLSGRDWRKLHLAKSTFYQRKKKVEKFFEALKQRVKPRFRACAQRKNTDSTAILHPVYERA